MALAPPNTAAPLPALDGLRGLAVLIVLCSHMANAGLPVLPGLSLSGTGKSGVYLFFVLSAYLLTRLLLAWPRADWGRWPSWADYASRRILRIWPLYLVVLLTSAAMSLLGVDWWPYPMPTAALLAHLGLQEGVSVLWSIPVEFHYYLWLPLVAFGLILAGRTGGLWMAGAAAMAAGIAATLVWPPSAALPNDVRLGPYLVLFVVGAFAAWLSRHWEAHGVPRRLGMAGVIAILALVITVPAIASLPGFVPFTPNLNHRWFAFFAVAWSVLLLAVVHGPIAFRRPFVALPLRMLGWVSFSAYLWHMPVLAAVTGPLGLSGVAALAVFAALTAIASWASWRWVERPLQRVRWPARG